jgi:hypothetical protein
VLVEVGDRNEPVISATAINAPGAPGQMRWTTNKTAMVPRATPSVAGSTLPS